MLRHSHPTLAGPILDLKRNPAEFCLIDPIVRQVWCDSPTSSRLAEGSAVKYKKTMRQMATRRAKGCSKPMGRTS